MMSSLLIFLTAASVSVMIILGQCKVTYYNFTQLKTHSVASARLGKKKPSDDKKINLEKNLFIEENT